VTSAWIADLPLLAEVDVCVVGGGSAGSAAAISAARGGASVLVLDALPFLGGTGAAVLDTIYGAWTPGAAPRKVVGGILDEVVAALHRLGPVVERPNTYGAGTGITYLAEHLKVAWERLVVEAGARVLLHASLVAVAQTDERRIRAIAVATKAGLRRIEARAFVDASGDADLCAFAGFGFERAGDLDPAQSLTTTFRMANVDRAARATIDKAELHRRMAEAAEDGYDLPRREGSDHVTPIEGVTATVMTRLSATFRTDGGAIVDTTDPWFLTGSEIAGRRQALEYARFLVDRVPGYERATLVGVGTRLGVRETRRVYGEARLTRADVLAARQFPDQIGLCGAPIEDHGSGPDTRWTYLPDGAAVGIPFGTLVVRDAEDVLVAGRCFSASHDAHASVRSIAQCIAMGQAAGTAAALAVGGRGDGTVRAVDARVLRTRLSEAGAIVDEPLERAA
jgi:ribulose 1,5-bisphosphate synthetase/thiazole synthase